MTVVVQTPFNQHVANGVSTVFGFTFQLLASGDLEVSLDGVEQMSGYTISGLGVEAGGSITFDTAPGNGVAVRILRRIPLARSTDYQVNGDLPADVLDDDFDRLWQAMQDAAYFAGLTVGLPFGDTAAPMTLPEVADRAGKFLGFDGDGNAIAADATSGGVLVSAYMETLLDDPDAATARTTLGLGPLATATVVPIVNGGTGATSAAAARTALGTGDGANLTDNTVTPAKLTQKFTVGAAIPTTSGANIDINSVFPSWARHIRLGFVGVSHNGTDPLRFQLGDSGGIENSGYSSNGLLAASGSAAAYAASTAGFDTGNPAAATFTLHGIVEFISADGLTWACVGNLGNPGDGRFSTFGGSKTLSAALDRIRVTTPGGANTFDAGFIIPSWQ